VLYFDHNATSPLLPEACRAWLEAADQFIGNPSSPHRVGARAEAALSEAREQVAAWLKCHALDVVWTSGATEANNMVLHHFAQMLAARAEVWISALEHPSVLHAARHYFPKRLRLIPALPQGVIDLDWLAARLKRCPPGLVAVMAANNETGVLQPCAEALALCRKYGAPFFCDAVQWLGRLPAQGLPAGGFLSAGAHKFGGPRGVGFLKCPVGAPLHPLVLGGPQEEGRRAGTENVAGVLAMVAALKVRQAEFPIAQWTAEAFISSNRALPAGLRRRLAWREAFEQRLLAQLPGAEIVGWGAPRLWNTVSVLMPEGPGRPRWVVKLDKLGLAVSTGSACASGKEQPSHVLAAMRYTAAQAGRALRFSSGWETTEADWTALAAALEQVYRNPRNP
jgi:cysteine desulfurase